MKLESVGENVRLRKKAILSIAIITTIVFSFLSGVVHSILMTEFTQLEKKNADENVQRAIYVLADDLSGLERTAYDWAAFDETYKFMQDPQNGQDYVIKADKT